MTSPVLLARPHAFIVSDMKPFLEEAGFKVIKTESLPQLADLSRGCVGAVISLALSSPINASPEEVIKSLRQANPGLPLMFAALLPYAKAKDNLERIGRQAGLSAKVFGLEDMSKHAEIASPAGLLYLSKDDLAGLTSRQLALQAIRRHFGSVRR